MPFKDKEKRLDASRKSMERKRKLTPMLTPDKVNPDVNPLDSKDWSGRRNYSAVYLEALDKQKGKLTEASAVAMKGCKVPFSYSYTKPSIEGHLREWLKDSVQRKKLGDICLALKRHGNLDNVTFGAYGPTFTEIGNILDETSVLN